MKEKCKHNGFPVIGEYIFKDIRSKFQNRHVDFKLVTDGTRTDFVQFTQEKMGAEARTDVYRAGDGDRTATFAHTY